MAFLDKTLLDKNGEYCAFTMEVRDLYDAIYPTDGRKAKFKVMIPKEQRAVKSSGVTYTKKRDIFLAHFLVHTFLDNGCSASLKRTLKKVFGKDIKFVDGTIQFVGISVDEEGYVYLSDGQHRFLYYLRDWFNGTAKLSRTVDYGSDYLNENMAKLFNAIVWEDGDVNKDEIPLSIAVLAEEDIEAMKDQVVVAQCVKAMDEQERTALFIAMNEGTPPTQADLIKAKHGHENTYQSASDYRDSIMAWQEGEPLNLTNGYSFPAEQAQILRILFCAPMPTLIPMIAHTALLTHLPKEVIGQKYSWSRDYKQSQTEQVRNFFKATQHMTRKEADELLYQILKNVVAVGETIYRNNNDMMVCAHNMRSLLVGQMHSLNNQPEGIVQSLYESLAHGVTNALVNEKKYTPPISGSIKPYDGAFFNNGHRLRTKSELFAKWVQEEYTIRQEVK